MSDILSIPDTMPSTEEVKKQTPPLPVGLSAPVVKPQKIDWSTLQVSDAPKEVADVLAVSDDPQGIYDEVQANVVVAEMTGLSIPQIEGNLEPIGEELYGEKVSPPNLFKKITNSWSYADLMRQKNKLGAKMALGDDTPETKQAAAEITAKLPKPEEVLSIVPNAVLSFIHQTYNAAKIIAIGETSGSAVDQAKQVVQNHALSTLALLALPGGTGALWNTGRALKDYTEQTIGNYYLTQVEAGVDPTIARISTAALTATDLALNSIPLLKALGAGAKVAKEVAGKAVTTSLLRGTIATVSKELAKQGAYGYGQAVIHTIVPEIAKTLSEKVTGGECSFKDAKQILTEIGIEGTLNTLPDLITAGASMGTTLIRAKRGGAIDLELKAQLRKIEQAVPSEPVAKTVDGTKVPVELPTPLKKKIGDILLLSDADITKLDADVKSAESSADYIKSTDLTYKQGIQEGKLMVEAHDLMNKYVADIRKVDVKKLLPEFADPIKDILENFTPEHFRADTVMELTKLRDGLASTESPDLSDATLRRIGELHKTSFKDMAVEDVKTIHDAILQYQHLAWENERIRVAGLSLERAVVVGRAINDLPTVQPTKKGVSVQAKLGEVVQAPKEIIAVPDIRQKIQSGLRDIQNTVVSKQITYMDLVERLGKTTKQVIGDAMDEGYTGHQKYTQDVNAELKQRTVSIENQAGWLNELQSFAINDAQQANLSRGYKLALYMHAKNPQNRAHLTGDPTTSGFALKLDKYSRHKIFRMTDAALDEIVRGVNANPQEKLYVDTVSDILSRMGKQQAEVYAKLNGIPLELVDAYYHIDTVPMQRKSNREERMALLGEQSNEMGVGPSQGHLKERTGSVIPLYLNPITHDLAISRDLAANYINLAEPSRNAMRLIRDPDFATKLADINPDLQRNLTKAIRDMNHQHDPIPSFERFSLKIRNNMGMGILAFPNEWPVIKQLIALPRYSMYVDAPNLIQGTIETVVHHKAVRALLEAGSPGFVDRIEGGQSREMADILRASKGSEIGGKLGWRQKLMKPMRWQDAGVVESGMMGAYNKVMKELKAGKLSPIVNQILTEQFYLTPDKIRSLDFDGQKAIAMKYADYATSRTQVMSSPQYQSDWQRGSPFQKATTLFMSENIASLNMVRRLFAEAVKKGTSLSWGRVVKAGLIVFGGEQLANMAVNRARRVATGGKQPELEKEILATFMNAPLQGAPVVGAISQAVTNKMVLGWDSDNFSLMPMENAVNLVIKVGTLAGAVATAPDGYRRQKAAGQMADAMGELLGMSFGLPYVPLRTNVKMGITLYNKLAGVE